MTNPVIFENHGDRIVDNYEWLRRDKEGAAQHLKNEQTRCAEETQHLKKLREALFREIKSHIKEDHVSLPVRKGEWWFYSKTEAGKSYPYYYRIQAAGDFPPELNNNPNEEMIFDANAETLASDFFSLGTFCFSNNGKYLLYGVDREGGELYTLRIRDLDTHKDLPDVIHNTAAGAYFHPDGNSFFYCTVDEALRPDKVWKHTLGSDSDELIFHDPKHWTGFELSRSERVLFIHSGNSQTSSSWILDLQSSCPVNRGVLSGEVIADDRAYTNNSNSCQSETVQPEGYLKVVAQGAAAEIFESEAALYISETDSSGTERVKGSLFAGSEIQSNAESSPAGYVSPSIREVWPREENVLYSPEHAVIGGQDILLIIHNRNAVNFELVAADFTKPLQFTPLIPHSLERNITNINAFDRHWVVSYRQNGLPKLAVARLEDAESCDAALENVATVPQVTYAGLQIQWKEIAPEADTENYSEIYSTSSGANEEWLSGFFQVSFESFTRPRTTYMYNVASREFKEIHRAPVLNYDHRQYAEKRIWAVAEDGTEIPISLVFHKDRVQFPAPCLLYGYGSYGLCIDPGFSASKLSLLDRGVVYAIAHVRGGGEMGENWYRQAKYENKPRTFSDFIACAKTLISNNYTSSDQLAIEGRSAGGLLIGAVVNLAPELFTAAVAGVPFVDVLTTMLMPELPLTTNEYTEWGNPTESRDAYRWIKSYSPYHNIAENASHYPVILAVTGTKDPRVSFIEPTKWVCKLREKGAQATLYINDTCGHFGASGRYDLWKSWAWEMAWVLDKICPQKVNPATG